MENKNDSFGKTRKQHSKTFAANFFDSLDFLNKSLINNKGIKVSNKHCTETFEESTTLLPEESVKKERKRHKKNSSSIEDEEPAIKHITSTEEKKKRHKTKSTIETCDIESISVQNYENIEVLGETVIKEKRKRRKNKSAFKEHDIEGQKDASLELNNERTIHKNKLASLECVQSVTNVDILSIKGGKKRAKTKSAFTELDNQNIVIQNEENVETADLIELINRVKKRYERKSSSIEVEKPAMKHITNGEEKQKKHKRNFNEHDDESISAQNKANFKVLHETVVKEKKRHKNKSAFKEHDIVVPKNTSIECFGKNAKNKNKFSEESVHNVTNGEVLGEELIKEKNKSRKIKSASTKFDNENFVIQKEKSVKAAKLIKKKKKKHQTEFSDVAEDNDTSLSENIDFIQEAPVKKKKKRKRKNSDIEEDDNIIVENRDSIQELPVKMKKKHKRKNSDIEEDNDSILLENIDSIQKGPVKKKKHKRKHSDIAEDNDKSLLENIDSIQKGDVKKKKRKRKFSDIVEDVDTNLLENRDSILEDSVKKLKKELHTSGQVTDNVKKDDFTYEKPTKDTRKKYKLFSQTAADEYFASQGHANLESANKKENKRKHKSTNFDCNDQSHKTQSDAGLQRISDNKRKKEVKDCPRNSQLTTHTVKKNKLMTTRLSSEDDELLLQGTPLSIDVSDLDLNEDPVDFEIPLLHSSEKVCQLNEEEKEALKSHGIIIKLGKFTKLEDSLLRRNYNEFTKRFQINDPQILLGIGQTSRKKDVLSFLNAKHFYVRLGKDVTDRPLYNIYRRARLLFSPLNKETKLDKADVSRIRKAYSRMGSKWQEIGNIIEKSAETTRQAFLWHDKSINRGKWTAKEEKQLTSAIKTVSGKRDLSKTEIDGAISWEKIADLVPTRNFHQCRLHWTENLSCKFKKMGWTKKDYGKLVSILRRKFYVDDFVNVNWKDVQKCFGDISWQFLRKKWYHLAKIFRQSKKEDKVITYKKMLDHYCITYNIKTD